MLLAFVNDEQRETVVTRIELNMPDCRPIGNWRSIKSIWTISPLPGPGGNLAVNVPARQTIIRIKSPVQKRVSVVPINLKPHAV